MSDQLFTFTLSQWKDIAAVGAALLALGTLLKGVIEYVHQGAQKRAEHFVAMRKRLKENLVFEELCALLEANDPKLKQTSFKDKRSFLGFFEEVALMMNSGLIRRNVTHYMFGYYAMKCWDSDQFWSDLDRDSIYWALLKNFVEKMKLQEKTFNFYSRQFRF